MVEVFEVCRCMLVIAYRKCSVVVLCMIQQSLVILPLSMFISFIRVVLNRQVLFGESSVTFGVVVVASPLLTVLLSIEGITW